MNKVLKNIMEDCCSKAKRISKKTKTKVVENWERRCRKCEAISDKYENKIRCPYCGVSWV